jgi:hypothetical protein
MFTRYNSNETRRNSNNPSFYWIIIIILFVKYIDYVWTYK